MSDLAAELAAATAAAATLASAERWRTQCEEVGIECAHVSALDAVTGFLASCAIRGAVDSRTTGPVPRFEALAAAIRAAGPAEDLPRELQEAARACARPWGVPRAPDWRPERSPMPEGRLHPPARAMAVGGGDTEDLGVDGWIPIQRCLDWLVDSAGLRVAFLVDGSGTLCAASGDVDNLDTSELSGRGLAALWACDPPDSTILDALLSPERFAEVQDPAGIGIRIQLLSDRAVLVLVFDLTDAALVRAEVPGAVRELERLVDAPTLGPRVVGSKLGEVDAPNRLGLRRITEEDLRAAFET